MTSEATRKPAGPPPGAPGSDVIVVLSTLPSAEAERIAEILVREQLAACVNLLSQVQSIYRWEGAVQKDEEVLALIKTTSVRADALFARLRELHPYQVPEILALSVERGLEAYLAWVRTEAKS